jgi:hypothetical protein
MNAVFKFYRYIAIKYNRYMPKYAKGQIDVIELEKRKQNIRKYPAFKKK